MDEHFATAPLEAKWAEGVKKVGLDKTESRIVRVARDVRAFETRNPR